MGRRILLIDDDTELCAELVEILADEGYTVTMEHDGLKGKDTFDAGSFDLLLLDLKLPSVNGYELLRHVKTVRPRIPVIVLSGRPVHSHLAEMDPNFQDREYVLKLADGFINKPYDIEKLLTAISTQLSA